MFQQLIFHSFAQEVEIEPRDLRYWITKSLCDLCELCLCSEFTKRNTHNGHTENTEDAPR